MTSNAAHTPGRLYFIFRDHAGRCVSARLVDDAAIKNNIASIAFYEPHEAFSTEQIGRRLVACWNAAHDAGLSTEALEAGVMKEMVETLRKTFIAVRLAAEFPAVSEEYDFSYVINKMSAILATLSASPHQSQEERG